MFSVSMSIFSAFPLCLHFLDIISNELTNSKGAKLFHLKNKFLLFHSSEEEKFSNVDFKKQFLLLFARGKYHYFVKKFAFFEITAFWASVLIELQPQNIFPGKRKEKIIIIKSKKA
jgi:hypothetical protein